MTIKPGDLVMIVKPMPCCGDTSSIGQVFVVTDDKLGPVSGCVYCGDTWICGERGKEVPRGPKRCAFEFRLKKIPPLREPEIIEERLAVKA